MKARDFVRTLEGFDEATVIPLASYRDCTTLFVTPTRTDTVPHVHASAVRRMSPIQNQKRYYATLPCGEVSDAYNEAVAYMMQRDIRYLFTLEDDNIPPWDTHLKLLDAMERGGFDMIGGLYRAKAPSGMHMAWGFPEDPECLITRDPAEHIKAGEVMEVNAIPTGCTIIKREVLEALALEENGRKLWFRQLATPDGYRGHDIDFSLRARAKGFKLGVHCGVLVGHYDVSEGLCYWPHVDQPTRSLECPG